MTPITPKTIATQTCLEGLSFKSGQDSRATQIGNILVKVSTWQPRQRVKATNKTDAARNAPPPQNAGLPQNQFFAGEYGQNRREQKGQAAASEGDHLPITRRPQLMGGSAHDGKRETPRQHPKVRQ